MASTRSAIRSLGFRFDILDGCEEEAIDLNQFELLRRKVENQGQTADLLPLPWRLGCAAGIADV
jgi:hypothetical protein